MPKQKIKPAEITEAQAQALEWFGQQGGEGIVDQYGYVIAGGERASQFDTATWLRLVAAEAIVGRGKRLYLVADAAPRKET